MESLSIINKIYEAYKAIIDLNNRLEKRWKYTIGVSLGNSILDCMENLIMAKKRAKNIKNRLPDQGKQ